MPTCHLHHAAARGLKRSNLLTQGQTQLQRLRVVHNNITKTVVLTVYQLIAARRQAVALCLQSCAAPFQTQWELGNWEKCGAMG